MAKTPRGTRAHIPTEQPSALLILAAALALSAAPALAQTPAKPAAPSVTPAAPASPAPAPPSAAPAPAASPTTPPPPPPPPAAPAPTTAPAPAPSDAAAPAAPASAPPAGQSVPPPPPPPPPPPQYQPLGGVPEGPIEEGAWNPWDHPAPGRYSHDGFFLRLTLGFGGAGVGGDRAEWDGPGIGMGLAIGGSIIENLALHADFQNTMILSPTEKLKNGPSRDFGGDIAMSSFGIGVTYFFMPVDLYLSGGIGIGQITFENDAGQQYNTNAGPVLNLMFGKEWWVGYDWGIGLAAQFLLMGVHDHIDGDLGGAALNLLFSATYN